MPALDREYVRRLEDFTKALEGIVELLKDDTKKENVDNVTRMLSNMDNSIGEIVKNIEIVKESVSKIEDQNDKIIREIAELKKQKEGGGLGSIAEVDNKKKIIDAVSMIVLIAGGILAIGLAFKLIAPVDFLSVLAIGLALVFISGAFVAVSTVMKEIEPKKARESMGLMILMAGAITVSSWFLAMSSTLTLEKSLSIVFTTTALGVSLYLMAKAVKDSKLTASDYPKMMLLPLILPLIAAGIAFSSYFLGMTQPMSTIQMITTVFVAGAIGISLYLISKSLESSKFTTSQIGKFLLLPILLPAVAASIVLSSFMLQNVQTLSFGQMVSSIFVAVTVGVLVYLMKPLIEKMQDLSFKSVVNAGLLVVALSAGLVAASWILSKMTFFTLREAFGMVITSVAIGLSVLVLTPAIKMLKSITDKEMWQATKNVVMASGAIAVSSILLTLGMYNNYPDWRWAVGAGLSIIGFAGAIWVLNKMNIDNKKMLSLTLTLVGIAGAIMLTSVILSLGNYRDYPSLGWSLGVGLTMLAFGGAMYLLGQKADVKNFVKGGLIALGIATALVLVSHILAAGNYKQYPTVEWGVGAGLALVAFGGGIFLLGTIAKDPTALLVGSLAALLVAGTVAVASHILALGAYDSYPTLDWANGAGLSMVVFGGSMLLLGASILATAGLGALAIIAGAFAMVYIAKTVVSVSEILSGGSYTGGPSMQWALGTGSLLATVGASSVLFAYLFPFVWLGRKSMIMTAETIAEVSHILQKGDYKGGPTLDWAKGVSMSIKAFAEGSAALSGGVIGNIINKIFGIDQTGVITKIAHSMVEASHILQEGDWSAYPSEEWSKGVGNSVLAFAKAIEAMEKGGVKGGFAISMTIKAVAKGIIAAAEILNEFDWKNIKNYPSETWSSAVGKAINAFAEPIAKLAENKVTGREIKTSIKRLAQGMVAAAETLAEINWLEYNDIYPHEDWVNGVGSALEVFVKYLSEIEKNDIGNGELKVLRKTIGAMVYAARTFKINEMILDGLWDAGPRNDWSSRVGTSIGVFVKYLTEIEKNDIGTGDVKVLNKTIDSMISTARRFKIAELIFKDIWEAGPKSDWSKSTGQAIGTFVSFLETIEKSNLGKSDLKVLNSTIDSMISTAYRFMLAEFLFKNIWEAGPDSGWVERTGNAISLFVDYLRQIEESGAGKTDLKILNGTIDTMIATAYSFRNAQFLYKDLWKGYPSLEWVTATGLAIDTFVNYLVEIEESGAGITDLNVLSSTIGAIIRTATGFQMVEKKYPGLWNAGPSEDWALNVGKIITSFVDNLISIDSAGIGGKDLRIFQGVVEAIVDTSTAFSKGTWSNPPADWITGMSSAVGEFVKQLITIDKSEIGKDDLRKFNKILNSIINTAENLQDIKPVGLTKEWSENTGKVIGIFVKQLEAIESSDISGSDLRVLNKTIKAIIYTAEELSEVGSIGISSEWSKVVGSAIGTFVKYLIEIEKSGVDGSDLKALKKTINAIIYTAEELQGIKGIGITSQWSDITGKALNTFVDYLVKIEKSAISGSDLRVLNKTIKAIISIAEGLQNVSGIGIDSKWTQIIGETIGTFVGYLEKIEQSEIGASDQRKLNRVLTSIADTAVALQNISGIGIDSKWTQIAGEAIGTFVKYLIDIEASDIGKGDLKKLRGTIDAIIYTADKLQNIKNIGISTEWSQVVGTAIGTFVNYLIEIENSEIDSKDLKKLSKVLNAIVYTADSLQDINNNIGIDSKWSESVGSAIGTFVKHLVDIEDSKIGNADLKNLTKVLNAIIFTASSLENIGSIGIDSQWSDITGKAIGTFVKHLTVIEASDIGKGDLNKLSSTIQAIIYTADKLQNISYIGIDSQWSDIAGKAIGTFINYLIQIENSDIGKGDLKKLSSTIDAIIYTAKNLQNIEAIGIDSQWSDITGKAIGTFINYLVEIEKSDIGKGDLRKLDATVNAIYFTANKLQDVPSIGIDSQWSDIVGKTIGTFVKHLIDIEKSDIGGGDLKKLNQTINAIILTAESLQNIGKIGIDSQWSEITGKAIDTFIKHLVNIEKSDIGGGELKKLATTVNGIIYAAEKLQDIKGIGIDSNWSDVAGKAIGTFVSYLIDIENSDIGGGDLRKLESTVKAIVFTAENLQNIQGIGIDSNWSDVAGKAIGTFINYLVQIERSDIGGGELRKLTKTVKAITFTAESLKNVDNIGIESSWSDVVGKTLGTFIKHLINIENSDIGSDDLKKLNKTINAITLTAEKLQDIQGIGIDSQWSEITGKAIGTFVNYLVEIEKSDIGKGDLRKLEATITAITLTAKNLQNIQGIGIDSNWSDIAGKAIGAFINYLVQIEKSDIGKGDLRKLSSTIDAILYTAKNLQNIQGIGIDSQWSDIAGKTIGTFVKHLAEIEKSDIGKGDLKKLSSTINAIVYTAKELQDISGIGIDSQWADITGKAINAFLVHLERIEKSDIGGGDLKILSKTIDSIIKISKGLKGIETSPISGEWIDMAGKAIATFVKHLEIIESSEIGGGDLKSLDKIINSIIKISTGLSGVNQVNISSEWLNDIGNTIGTFVKHLVEIENSSIKRNDTRILSLTVGALVELSSKLSQVQEIGDLTWLDGLGQSIGTFVKHLVEIEKSDIKKNDLKILTLTLAAIVNASKQLSQLDGMNTSPEWIQGLGKAFEGFVKSLVTIEDSGLKNINVFKTSLKALASVVDGLKDANQVTISTEWIDSIGEAMSVFVKHLAFIESNDIGAGDMRVLNGTVNAIIKISQKFKGQELPVGPTAEWTNSIGEALGVFVSYLAIIEKQNIGLGDTIVLNKTVDGIIRTALRFSLAEKISPDMWKTGPSEYWSASIGQALTVFVKHLSMIEDSEIGEFDVAILNNTIDSIIGTALRFYFVENTLGKNLWKTGPSSEWSASVAKSISSFAQQVDYISKSNIKAWDLWKIGRIVGAIVNTAERYYEIETSKPGVWKAGPSLEWATSVSKTVLAFAQASLIASDANNLAGIDGLGDKMLSFTTKLEKAFSGKKLFGKGGLFEAFAQSIKNLSSSFTSSEQLSKGISQFANAMVKISSMGTSTSDSIRLMTKSIELLSGALEDVDMESIDKLAKFSNGMLVLSLIDEDKFEKAFDVLQQKKNDIISILSDNNAVKSSRDDYGSTRVEVTSAESAEAKNFYKTAIKHLSGLDNNVDRVLKNLSEKPQVKETNTEVAEVLPVPNKTTKK